jgi:hypothetical protein
VPTTVAEPDVKDEVPVKPKKSWMVKKSPLLSPLGFRQVDFEVIRELARAEVDGGLIRQVDVERGGLHGAGRQQSQAAQNGGLGKQRIKTHSISPFQVGSTWRRRHKNHVAHYVDKLPDPGQWILPKADSNETNFCLGVTLKQKSFVAVLARLLLARLLS